MFKRFALALVAVALVCTPALAGNRPEFDTVGNDACNFFNDDVKEMVVCNAYDGFGKLINWYSDWTCVDDTVNGVKTDPITGAKSYQKKEFFKNTAGLPYPDPCFPCYLSVLTDVYNQGTYEWKIVLQMKPESDIDLNIRDCVMKHNEFCVWTGAEQTGRYRAPWGQLFFIPSANPTVFAEALPGPFATNQGGPAVTLDARVVPGLGLLAVNNVTYTSKGLWEDGIVLALPETGVKNTSGQDQFNLKQGDMIHVVIKIPANNSTDIRYGQDNVSLKYIGIVGTDYVNMAGCAK